MLKMDLIYILKCHYVQFSVHHLYFNTLRMLYIVVPTRVEKNAR